MIEMVVFLGNKGPQYSLNRHNAGWRLATGLPFYDSLAWKNKFSGSYASLKTSSLILFAKETVPALSELPACVHFFMPHTFMNLSGEALYPAAGFFKIPLDHILVVHDELELPLGTVSFKFSGGLGGHNGLRSIKARFSSADFWRLRIGIGRPDHSDIASWVLEDFSGEEETVLAPVLEYTSAALMKALLCGPGSMLPDWKKKKIEYSQTTGIKGDSV